MHQVHTNYHFHVIAGGNSGLESENLYPTRRNWHQLVRRTSRPKSLNPNPDIDVCDDPLMVYYCLHI